MPAFISLWHRSDHDPEAWLNPTQNDGFEWNSEVGEQLHEVHNVNHHTC